MSRLLEHFIPVADVRERHETIVRAPAPLVYEVARALDIESIPPVHAIFWLREKILGAAPPRADLPREFVPKTLALGWGVLHEEPGRELIMGAVCQPWVADVRFVAIPPERFVDYAEPDRVKIVWTIETEPMGDALTRLTSETRVSSIGTAARRKFRRYWRIFGIGIVGIRWLVLPAIRREAERRARFAPVGGTVPSYSPVSTGASTDEATERA